MRGDLLPVALPPQLCLTALIVVTSTTGFSILTIVLLQTFGLMKPDSKFPAFLQGPAVTFTNPLKINTKEIHGHLMENLCNCVMPSLIMRISIPFSRIAPFRESFSSYGTVKNCYAQQSHV